MKKSPKLMPEGHLLKMLIEWSSINTYSLNLEGLGLQLKALIESFAPLGDSYKVLDLAPFETLSDTGVMQKRTLGKALLVRARESAPRQILLSGHYDTVYPLSSSFQKPIISNDKKSVNGPGVTDMKGGLLILLSALNAFETFEKREDIGWTLIISPDEEIGSPGSKYWLDKLAKKADIGIAFEPCLANGDLVHKRKGSLNFTISSYGKAAHAGRDFFSGVSAIYQILPLLEWCSQSSIADTTINVGKVQGGGPLNVVPDYAQFGACVRSKNESGINKIREELQRQIAAKEKSFAYHEISYRPPKEFDSETEKLFNIYAKCSESIGEPIEFQSSGGVCDGNNIAANGVPTIDTVGAKGGNIHSEQEYIEISSLTKKANVLFLFLDHLAKMPKNELPAKKRPL